MGIAKHIADDFDSTSCCSCGIKFAVPYDWILARRRDGKTFYCPNGHRLWYGKSEREKLKEQLDAEKQNHQRTLSRLNAEKAAHERLEKEMVRAKKRTAAGVCPCCNRTFQQLARHMKTKHPEQT